ncbi:MAG: metallophosphoesterase family protein [Deltaproteobacteria bacterium]|nr:metallophosphoesterase family protein [Deltaproteobacteria bacterium]
MLVRVVMKGVVPAALLLAVSCGGGGGAVDAGSIDVDNGKIPPVDVLEDVPDVPIDVYTPPPAEHKVPIGAEDPTFHVGPHVMHTTQASVAIVWETEEAGGTRVEYGVDDGYGSQVEGAAGTMHEVVVTELKPATVYHYRACADELCTADLTFATAPVPGQKFRFAVYGDSRSDPVSHGAVAQSIIQSEPALVLNMGDIVGNGERPQYKEQHFDPSRQLGHHVPIYVSIGNHEWKEAEALGELDVPNFREYLAFPVVPEHRIGELSYSFTFGDAFFIALDNTIDGADIFFPLGDAEMPLAKWLREQAESDEAKKAKWRFAFMHYPPASPCHEDWMNMAATRDHVIPLLRANGFHALFAGHVHDYERQDWDGFPVIVSGGGGAELEDTTLCNFDLPEIVELYSAHHHLTVDLGDDEAHVRAVSLQGEVFDEITISQAGMQ